MTWVVDTCVLIDVLKADPIFAKSSSAALQSKMDDVLIIAPITYVELAPAFRGNVEAQNEFLNALWIRYDFEGIMSNQRTHKRKTGLEIILSEAACRKFQKTRSI